MSELTQPTAVWVDPHALGSNRHIFANGSIRKSCPVGDVFLGIVQHGIIDCLGFAEWKHLGVYILAQTFGSPLFGICFHGTPQHQGPEHLTGYESTPKSENKTVNRKAILISDFCE